MRDISLAAHALVDEQYTLYNDHLTPALKKAGAADPVARRAQRRRSGAGWHAYFAREVRPLLVPVSLDPAHPFPQVANKSLHFIVRLQRPRRLRARERHRDRAGCRARCRA